MLARAAEKAGAYVLTAASRTSCSEGRTGDWEICAERDGKQLIFHAKFLVDATGRASTLARKRGAGRIFYDRLVGVVVFLSALAGNPLGDYTFVEAVQDGWWYSALLPNSRVVVAHMTDTDLNAQGSSRAIQCWQKQLDKTTHTKALINSCALESGPFIVAANSSKLNTLFDRNWLAVGDAAAASDPLSSQGVYKALESGIRAARAIRDYFGGDGAALRSYAGEMEKSFDQYLLMRNKYYGLERRWPHSPFWRRRRLGCSLKGC
jgi:flavin-dependent dehydrogenase